MACTQCNACARTFKIIVLMIAVCGLIFSTVGAWNCRLVTNETIGATTNNSNFLDKIGVSSDNVDVGNLQVGYFGYEAIDGTCKTWPEIFSNNLGLIYYSQVCIAAAIACAALGILATIVELLCCNFVASCAFSAILFLSACFLASAALGTFIGGIYTEGLFVCGSGDVSGTTTCTWSSDQQPALLWTIASIVCYFWAGCMLCCIPRPDPLLCNKAKDDQNENKDGRNEQQQQKQQHQQRDIEENVNNNGDIDNYAIPVVTVADTATPTPVMAVTGVAAVEPVLVTEKAEETEA